LFNATSKGTLAYLDLAQEILARQQAATPAIPANVVPLMQA
jgi:hypothetical protein